MLGIVLLVQPSMTLADQAPDPNAPEVLARGPIHEAYAEPVEQQPTPGPALAKEPPNPIDELPPDQKPAGDHVIWLPGYWAYDADRQDYIWVSGFWRATPPGKVWMPGSWRKADNGYQWVGGFWNVAQQDGAQVQYLPQPPAPVDSGPATPAPNNNPNAVYVPGAWIYRDGRYLWRAGYWIEYRPNWIWIPAHYRWTPAGYVFIDGYWDYALADRGMLFAPAYVSPAVYGQPGYYYQPTVVVREQCVFGALFVRRGYGGYYFGDYYGPAYGNAGYVAWCGYGGGGVVVRGWYDPMWGYYQVHYRDDPAWRGGVMVNLYVGRYRGDVPRPPVTLVAQNNIFINNSVTVNINVNHTQMLTTVAAAAKANPNMRMEPVPMAARQEHMRAAREIHEAAAHRAREESRMVAEHHGAMPRPNEAPRTAKMTVAKSVSRAAAVTSANHAANNTSTNHTTTNNSTTPGHGATNTTNTTSKTNTTNPMNPASKTNTTSKSKTDPKHPAPKKETRVNLPAVSNDNMRNSAGRR